MPTVRIDGEANTMEDSVMKINDKMDLSLEVTADQSECVLSIDNTLYPRFFQTVRVQ